MRRLPRAQDLFAKPDDPLAVTSQAASGKVNLEGGVPYSLLVVNGTDRSPVVQVRDPQGKLVLDDNGQSVQGLPDTPAPRAPVETSRRRTRRCPNYTPPKVPQGILHNDGSDFHDDTVDLRHATLIVLRNPKKGAYTITTKEGSAPITAISHSNGLPLPKISGGVVRSGAKRMLTLSSKVPAGTTVTLAEEGRNLSHKIATIRGSANASSATAGIARASRHIRFKPALGPAGKRQIVATLSRNGIALHRMVVGSYRAPAPPKPGPVRGLRVKAKGSKLTVTFKKARNAQRYAVTVVLRKGLKLTRSVAGKRHRLVLRDPLIRQGATVTVSAIGPMTDAGKAAKRRVKAQKVKKPKRFVL